MIHNRLKLLFLCIIFSACAQQKKHIITGKITSSTTPQYMYLLKVNEKDQFNGFKILDSSKIKNHQFYFDFKLKNDYEVYTIGFKPSYFNNGNYYYNRQENLHKTIIVNKQGIHIEIGDNFENIVFNDPLNKDYNALQKDLEAYAINSHPKYDSILKVQSKARYEQDSVALEKSNAKYYELADQLKQEKKIYLEEFLRKNDQNLLGLHIFEKYLFDLTSKRTKEDIALLQGKLASFKKHKNTAMYASLHEKITKYTHCAIGGIFPELEGNNINDTIEKLSQYKGKYVLLDFWFKNCKPCKLEVPYLKKLHEKYKDKGLVIISYSIDQGKFWKKTVAEEKEMNWKHLSSLSHSYTNEMTNRLCIEAFPTLYLLSPEGVVLENNLRQEKLYQAVSKRFDNL